MAYKFHNSKDRMKPVSEAFSEKYEIDEETGCWNWVASKMRTGYGQFNPRNGKIVTAHRYSYKIHKGEIPDGLFVCHTCDNRACVNPDHLWLGTCAENLEDMKRKGRSYKPGVIGERNGSSKVTEKDVVEIRRSNLLLSEVAKKYGISETAASNIRNFKTWKHVRNA